MNTFNWTVNGLTDINFVMACPTCKKPLVLCEGHEQGMFLKKRVWRNGKVIGEDYGTPLWISQIA